MFKSLVATILVMSTTLSAQIIQITDNLEATYFHAQNTSIYVGNFSGGSVGDIYELGYQGYLNYQLESDFSVNFGAQPSIMRFYGNSFNLFLPLFIGGNYGKEGFSDLAISDKKVGFFLNFGAGPVMGIVNSPQNHIGGFSEIGTRLNFRRNDISFSLISFNGNGAGYNGVRVSYHLDPF